MVEIFKKKKAMPKILLEGSLQDLKKETEKVIDEAIESIKVRDIRSIFTLIEKIGSGVIEKIQELEKYTKGIKKVFLKDSKFTVRSTEKEELEIDLNFTISLKRKK